MSFTVLIPARLASTRLPNKPLADLGGRPMVVRVAERAALSRAKRVVVAADDPIIVQACQQYGVASILTRSDHVSGTDRLAEASTLLGLDFEDVVVNLQGDEPLMDPELIDAVASTLIEQPSACMGTAAHAITSAQEFLNPNVVKVVLDANSMALYFSRAPIPWKRDDYAAGVTALAEPLPLRHFGIYSYRVSFLQQYSKLLAAPLEMQEALEQMRALWHGYRIAVHVSAAAPGPGVDTPDDLELVRRFFH